MKLHFFKIGDRVKIAPSNDNENYTKFKNKVLIITHVAKNSSEHRGYDSGMSPERPYDLSDNKGNDVPFSLYDYELIRAS